MAKANPAKKITIKNGRYLAKKIPAKSNRLYFLAGPFIKLKIYKSRFIAKF